MSQIFSTMTNSKTTNATTCIKPGRPLSAYNLFYRYKRAKIIKAEGLDSKNAVRQLVATSTGLENLSPNEHRLIAPDKLDEVRRTNIWTVLEPQLLAKDTSKRSHRKSGNGFKMSFTEMNSIMVASWKNEDKFTKTVFKELAEEGKRVYNEKLVEYNTQIHLQAVAKFNSMDHQPASQQQQAAVPFAAPAERHQSFCSSSPMVNSVLGVVAPPRSNQATGALFSPLPSLGNQIMMPAAAGDNYHFSRRISNESRAPLPLLPEILPVLPPLTTADIEVESFEPLVSFRDEQYQSSSKGQQRDVPTQLSATTPPVSPTTSADTSTNHGIEEHQRNVSVDDFMELLSTLHGD